MIFCCPRVAHHHHHRHRHRHHHRHHHHRHHRTTTSSSSSMRRRVENEMENEEALMPDIEDFGEEEALEIRASLLDWYDQNQRDLPWRKKEWRRDKQHEQQQQEGEEKNSAEQRAYGVWVSEVMLQQTRVQTVIHYYNRWMLKWPTLHSLSMASLEEINEMWAGLGYYRRARFLLEGAKAIIEGDGFPETVSALCKVPGIGNYTAGAIASIAFNKAVPVVDGNVVRVLSRLRAISANPKDSSTVKSFWKLAGQLVDPQRPGDFNQAIMELGAIVCSPLSPSCSSCPIASGCHALAASKQNGSRLVTDYPVKVPKANKRLEYSAVCVVELLGSRDESEGSQCESSFILVKRPDEGLLAGLWEFPSVQLSGEADLATRRKSVDRYLKKSFNLDPEETCSIITREDVGVHVHVFTHIRLKMYVELVVLRLTDEMDGWHKKLKNESLTWKCVSSKAITSMGLTSGVRKAYGMIQKFKEGATCISYPAKVKRKRPFSGV